MKKLSLFIISLLFIIVFSSGTMAQQFIKLSDFPENVKKTKPFQRFEWFYQQRAFPYDTVPAIKAARNINAELQNINDNYKKSNTLINWYSKGPHGIDVTDMNWWFGPICSGRVRALAVSPNDPLTVYIGASGGGIWKTTDGGESWEDIGNNLESLNHGAIAIDPNNPEIVYVGTGEVYNGCWQNIYAGNGLYKSENGGEIWTQIAEEDFGGYTFFSDLVVSPFDSNILFAALSSGSPFIATCQPNEGIWKSTDAGLSWNKCLDLPYGFDVLLHPNDPNIIYAAIGGMQDSSGFYISTDQGETWTASTGLAELIDPTAINRLQIDISLSDPNVIYAVIYRYWSSSRAFKSVDGGNSWEQIAVDTNLGGYTGSYWKDQGNYDLCIAVDPVDPNHVYIGNVELHETTDGQNFSPVRYPGGTTYDHGIAHNDYHKLVYAPSDPNYFYIGCDGGVFVSTDGCQTGITKNSGLETLQLYRMDSHPTNPDIMIGGLQDNGTVITYDGGVSWTVKVGGDGMECMFDHTHPDSIVYASSQFGDFYKSTNGGDTFTWKYFINGRWTPPIFLHPENNEWLYSANNKIVASTNCGEDWFQLSAQNVVSQKIGTMAQSNVNPDHMIAASYNGAAMTGEYVEVVITNDNWETWTDVTSNIPGEPRWIPRVVTHPIDENTMYLVRCGFSLQNKVYKTSDLGESWTNVSGNLPDIPCNDLFVDPEITNHYYVGTDLGVYFSANEGETWEYAGGDMPKVPVLDFDYVKIENTSYLRVATHGRGIYETTEFAVDIPEIEILSQLKFIAKPNPVTTHTTFEYELQRFSNVQMVLYNQLGEIQMELLNNKQAKGEHQVEIDLSNLKPGIYFCILKTDKRMQTRKVIKL